MTKLTRRLAPRLKIGAAAALAAGLLAGSIAPPAAATTWPPEQGFTGSGSHHNTAFYRHFWRGSQLSRFPQQQADMTALADESMPVDEATSYCASRFRSYDPSTGTYLGYDGNEHPCP